MKIINYLIDFYDLFFNYFLKNQFFTLPQSVKNIYIILLLFLLIYLASLYYQNRTGINFPIYCTERAEFSLQKQSLTWHLTGKIESAVQSPLSICQPIS